MGRAKRSVAWLATGCLATAGIAAFLPLPLGPLVDWFARTAISDPQLRVTVDAATVKWRFGEPELLLELEGLRVRNDDEPQAVVATTRLRFLKANLWRGRFIPLRVELLDAHLASGAISERKPHDRLRPDAGPAETAKRAAALADALDVMFADQAAALHVRVERLWLDARDGETGGRWFFPLINVNAERLGRTVEARVAVQLESPHGKVEVSATAAIDVDRQQARLDLKAPTFGYRRGFGVARLPRMQAEIAIGANVSAEFDLAAGALISASGAIQVAESRLWWSGLDRPFELLPAELRLSAGGEPLTAELRAELVERGGAVLTIEPLRVQLGWPFRATGRVALRNLSLADAGTLFSAGLTDDVGRYAAALPTLRIAEARCEAELDLGPRTISALAGSLTVAKGADAQTVHWAARAAANGGTAWEVDFPAINPTEWALAAGVKGLATLDLPVSARITGSTNPSDGTWTGAANVSAGPGTIGFGNEDGGSIGVRQAALAIEFSQNVGRVHVSSAHFDLSGPRVEVEALDISGFGGPSLRLSGGLRVENLSAGWCDRLRGGDVMGALAKIGMAAESVAVARFDGRIECGVHNAPDGSWHLAAGRMQSESVVRVGAASLSVRANATAAESGRFDAAIEVAPFRLSLLAGAIPAFAQTLSACDFPVGLQVAGEGAWSLGCERLRFSLAGGPGVIRDLVKRGSDIALRAVSIEGSASGDWETVVVASAMAELQSGLLLRGQNVSWKRAGEITGVVELGEGPLEPFVPWLPDTTPPSTGRLRGGRLAFGFARGDGDSRLWRLTRLYGHTGVGSLACSLPQLGRMTVGEAELRINYPQAHLTLAGVSIPGWLSRGWSLAADLKNAAEEMRIKAALRPEPVEAARHGEYGSSILGEQLTVEATLHGFRRARIEVRSSSFLQHPLELAGQIEWASAGTFAARLERFAFGPTSLTGSIRQQGGRGWDVEAHAQRIDLRQLAGAASILLAEHEAAAPYRDAGMPRDLDRPPGARPSGALDFKFAADRVEFGDQREGRSVHLSGRWQDGPGPLVFTGIEGPANRLTLSLGAVGRQSVNLSVDNAADWITALTAPFRETWLGREYGGSLLAHSGYATGAVASGAVELEGHLIDGKRFAGRVEVRHATLRRTPKILQMLAFKSRRSLGREPLIERIDVPRLLVDEHAISCGGATLAGAGLVDRLTVRSLACNLDDGRLTVDGDYFGVGFQVLGTRAEPQVYLKDDNLLVRTFGEPNEFDFEAMAVESRGSKDPSPATRR